MKKRYLLKLQFQRAADSTAHSKHDRVKNICQKYLLLLYVSYWHCFFNKRMVKMHKAKRQPDIQCLAWDTVYISNETTINQ